MSLMGSLGEGSRNPQVQERIAQLESGILTHFRTEEDFLASIHYPDLLPHQFEHEALLARVQNLMTIWSFPDSPPYLELVREVARLFHDHVARVDMAYVQWLEAQQRE